MGLGLIIGAVWGFAEATLFFIVPDVAMTYLAILGREAAWAGCVAAIVGALVGGALMYRWGAHAPERAQRTLLRVPAIHDGELSRVQEGIERSSFAAVFLGPLTGTPYKIYAVEVGRRGLSLPLFLLLSVPARGIRFVAATLLSLWLADGPLASWGPTALVALVTGFWIVFYLAYFRLKRG